METGIEKAIRLAGGVTALARLTGVKHGHIHYWRKRRVPAERVGGICRALDWQIEPHELRPDLYEDRAA